MSNKIFVVGGGSYGKTVIEFGKLIYDFRTFFVEPRAFHLVLFTGGEDVSPSLYGHKSCKYTYTSPFRDYIEKQVFEVAFENGIPMAGICRGLQFLQVMDGGLMIQHIENHMGRNHPVNTYSESFMANSLHHQMVFPADDAYIMAYSAKKQSGFYLVDKNKKFIPGPTLEIEAAYLPAPNAFAVQWHPEMLKPKDPAYKFFTRHVALLMTGELEEVLDKAHCPTMGIIEDKVGHKVKYKKRYKTAKRIVQNGETTHGTAG